MTRVLSSPLVGGIASILAARRAPMIGHLPEYGFNANTLTGLFPDLYAGMDVVSRELVGLIPGVSRSATAERAAVGQNVTYPVAPPATNRDITAAMTVPNPTDKVMSYGQMTINKSRETSFGFAGEEQRGLASGVGNLTVQADLFAQGLRSLVNEVEADGVIAAYRGASRAFGTAGTTPFASDLGAAAQVRKILDDNGAPGTGRSLVINTTAGAALRTLQQLTKVNESGTTMTLRDGVLLDIHGFAVRETGAGGAGYPAAANHTKGTAASATTNNAGYAVGATAITLASIGTGTFVAGDVITFAGDTNKYVVASGDADVSNGGTITLAAPGLRQAIPASTTAITVVNSYAINIGYSSNAIMLAARQPALPQEGDLALDRMSLTDPRSGLVFEVSVYPGFRMVSYNVGLAWGWEVTKAEHIATLLG